MAAHSPRYDRSPRQQQTTATTVECGPSNERPADDTPAQPPAEDFARSAPRAPQPPWRADWAPRPTTWQVTFAPTTRKQTGRHRERSRRPFPASRIFVFADVFVVTRSSRRVRRFSFAAAAVAKLLRRKSSAIAYDSFCIRVRVSCRVGFVFICVFEMRFSEWFSFKRVFGYVRVYVLSPVFIAAAIVQNKPDVRFPRFLFVLIIRFYIGEFIRRKLFPIIFFPKIFAVAFFVPHIFHSKMFVGFFDVLR